MRIGPFRLCKRTPRSAPSHRILPLDEREQRLLELHRRERAARGEEGAHHD